MNGILATIVVACALLLSMSQTAADTPVLTISGKIEGMADGSRSFTLDELKAIDWQTIETHTYWTDGPQTFSGPSLQAVLDMVDADGEDLAAVAINDYRVSIPASDAAEHGVILAMHHNGVQMRVRDKGPLWIIYPLDADEVGAGEFNERMIWQLRSIEIR